MSFASNELVFLPLGGSGEIGMNANLYHYNDRWLMVDLGISFPDETMPGIDVVLPDISYIEARKNKLEGLILTHAHEDHFGAIPYLWERLGVPIYGTAFTLALLRRKLAENRTAFKIPMHEIDFNIDYQFGPFSVELIALNHSIPDPAALAVRTPVGTVLHTGDWKFDETPLLGTDTDRDRLRAIGDEGVLALIGDSTNAMVPGRTPSEKVARDRLTTVISQAEKAVAITCFASNVARIRSIISAALSSLPFCHLCHFISSALSSPTLRHLCCFVISAALSSPPLCHLRHSVISATLSSLPLCHLCHSVISATLSSPPLCHLRQSVISTALSYMPCHLCYSVILNTLCHLCLSIISATPSSLHLCHLCYSVISANLSNPLLCHH